MDAKTPGKHQIRYKRPKKLGTWVSLDEDQLIRDSAREKGMSLHSFCRTAMLMLAEQKTA